MDWATAFSNVGTAWAMAFGVVGVLYILGKYM